MNKLIELSLWILALVLVVLGLSYLISTRPPLGQAPKSGTIGYTFQLIHLQGCLKNMTETCKQDFINYPEAAKEVASMELYRKAQVQGEFLGDVAPKYDPVGQPYKCFAVMCKDKRIILLDAIPGEEKGCLPQFWEDTNNVCNDK